VGIYHILQNERVVVYNKSVQNTFNIFLLFILPFLVFQFGISPFETPKIFIAQGAILLFVLSLLIFKKDFFLFSKDSVLLRFLIGVGALLVLQLIIFRDNSILFGGVYRLQGLFFMVSLLIFTYCSAQFRIKVNPLYIVVLLIAHTLLALGLGVNESNRAFGTLGEPNSLAAYTLFLWPFILLSTQKVTLVVKVLTAGLVLLLLYISGSRSGLIALFSQCVFLAILYKNISHKLAFCAAVAILAISLLSPFISQTYYENRADIWKAAVQAGYAKPVTGSGFGAIHDALSKTTAYKNTTLKARTVDSTHNIFLDWWVQGGVLGVLLLGALLYRSSSVFIAQNNTLILTIFIGILGAFLFNPMSIILHLGLWWIVGQSLAKETDI